MNGPRHPENVEGFGSPRELAVAVSRLRYDRLREFLDCLAEQTQKDSEADLKRGRPQLAKGLAACSAHLTSTAQQFRSVWVLCRKYMLNEPSIPGLRHHRKSEAEVTIVYTVKYGNSMRVCFQRDNDDDWEGLWLPIEAAAELIEQFPVGSRVHTKWTSTLEITGSTE